MSNWQIILTSILLCCSIHCIIRMLNNKLAQTYYEGVMNIIEVIEEYEKNYSDLSDKEYEAKL